MFDYLIQQPSRYRTTRNVFQLHFSQFVQLIVALLFELRLQSAMYVLVGGGMGIHQAGRRCSVKESTVCLIKKNEGKMWGRKKPVLHKECDPFLDKLQMTLRVLMEEGVEVVMAQGDEFVQEHAESKRWKITCSFTKSLTNTSAIYPTSLVHPDYFQPPTRMSFQQIAEIFNH